MALAELAGAVLQEAHPEAHVFDSKATLTDHGRPWLKFQQRPVAPEVDSTPGIVGPRPQQGPQQRRKCRQCEPMAASGAFTALCRPKKRCEKYVQVQQVLWKDHYQRDTVCRSKLALSGNLLCVGFAGHHPSELDEGIAELPVGAKPFGWVELWVTWILRLRGMCDSSCV